MIKTTRKAACLLLLFISIGLRAQMTGTYTIPGSFTSIAAAVASLNTVGVSGAVVINVTAGYTETAVSGGYTLNTIAGASAASSITFQKSGSGANPLVMAYTGGVGTPNTAVQDGVWRFMGTDYVTIDGLDISDPNTANPATMEFGYAFFKASATNGCQNNTIKNCTITLKRINNVAGSGPAIDGSRGIDVVNSTAAAHKTALTITSAAGANSNNKFYSNTIQNCNYGIALIGFADVTPFANADNGNDIGGTSSATGNAIINYGGGGTTSAAAGIRTLAQYSLNIGYNVINNNNGSGVNHAQVLRGIFMNTAKSANAIITNNTITVSSGETTADLAAIQNAAGGTAAGNAITITNNIIAGCSYTGATSANFYGVLNTAAAATVNITNNTFTNNYTNLMNDVFYVSNTGAVGTLNVTGNTISNNTTNSTGGLYYNIYNSGAVTSLINVSNNTIGLGTFFATSTSLSLAGFYNDLAGTVTATLSVNSNTFQSAVFIGTLTGITYVVYNDNQLAVTNMNSNVLNNITLKTTGKVYMFSNNSDTPNCFLSNNSITGFSNTVSSGADFYGYYNYGSPGSGTAFINANNLSNILLSGTSEFYGFFQATTNSQAEVITNNVISNITTGGIIVGIYHSYGSTGCAIIGNTVTGLSGGDNVFGIDIGEDVSSSSLTASLNIVGSCSTSGQSAEVIGLFHYNGLSSTLLKNKIYDLSASGTANIVYGIYVGSADGGDVQVYNNLIGDLRAPQTNANLAVIGIDVDYANTAKIYFNSVYLAASSSAANFGSAALYAADSPTLTLRNNILVNNSSASGTGFASAYQRSSTTLSTYAAASNKNLFYAGTPAVNHPVYYDGTLPYLSLNTFQTLLTNRDAASVTENPPFLSVTGSSANFLAINPAVGTQVESGAAPIAGITDDYAGITRNTTTPDIGAREGTYLPFASCTSAPAANAVVATGTLLCTNNVNNIVLPVTSTVTGLSYQWQQSTSGAGGPYTSVSGATTSVYNSTVASATTWYQAVITCSAGGTSSSTPVQVSVGPGISPAAIAASTMICPGQSSAISLTNAVASGIAYQWQLATTGVSGPYASIPGETLSTTNPANITVNSWYQAIVSCSASSSASVLSTPAMVSMGFPSATPVTTPSLSTVCSNQTVNLSLATVIGNGLSYQWKNSPAFGGPYTAIVTETNNTTAVTNVTANTWLQSVISCSSNASYSVASVPAEIDAIAGVTYTPTPFIENFEATWQNRCDLRNVPVASYWSSNPTTGNNSWRRQNDGVSAAWGNVGAGIVTAFGGTGAADFHSRAATSGQTGSMNLYLNMTAASPNYSLSFYYRNTTGSDSLEVLLSTNGGSSFTKVGGFKITSAGTPWVKKVINLGAVNSSSCVITFSATSDHSTTDIGIDSLEVKTCPNVVAASTASAALCAGFSQTLTASGSAYNYYWNTATTSNTAIAVTPTASSVYTLTGSNGLCAISKTIAVNINPNPTVTISGPSGLCTGQNATLVASGASTYSWDSGATTNSIVTSPSANVVYTVTGTDALGCKATVTQSITVAAGLNVQITGPSTICIGQTPTLTATGGVSYTWTAGPMTNTLATSPSVNTTYTVTGASGTCSNTAVKTISVNPNPTVTISGNFTVCAGQATTLTASGATSYSWNTSPVTSTISISPTGNTVYTVTGTNVQGCSMTATVPVSTNTLPVIVVAQSATAACAQVPVTFTASGASTYSWTSGPNTATNVVTPAATAVYTVSGTNALGCAASNTVGLTTYNLPVVIITPASPTICSTATVSLIASGALTYSWTGGPVTPGYTVNPANTSTYAVTGTSSNNCVFTKTVAVVTNSLPVIVASPVSATVCSQSPITYSVSGTTSYSWSNGGATTSTVNFFPPGNTTYTVTGTNAQGCASTATVAAVTLSLPVIAVSPSFPTVCINSPASFTASGAATYTWSSSSTTGSTTTITSASPVTSYSVSGTDPNGCVSGAPFVLFTNPLPVISIAASSGTVCSLAPVSFTASGAGTYSWSNGTVGDTVVIHPLNANTYTVTGTNTVTGCAGTQTVAVATTSLPVISIAPATPSVCYNSPLTLTGSGGVSYMWSNTSSNTSINLTPTVSATYSVTGTDALGCSGTQTVAVTVNPLPVINAPASMTVCLGEVATFTATGAATYTWMPGTVSGASFSISPGISSIYIYTVTGTDMNSCMNKTSVTLNVDDCTNIKTNSFTGNMVSVYPNPSNGAFTAKFDFAGEKTVVIMDLSGQVISQVITTNTSEAFNLSAMAKGIYFVKVSTKEASGNYKVIID